MKLPACGLYRTLGPIGSIPANRLVYFHNHGDPGPGLYLPESWRGNRAQMGARGTLLPSPEDARLLEPLPPEGFYRVLEAFTCCERGCRTFDADALVQLGYDGSGEAIVFVPEVVAGMLAVPEQGSRVDRARLDKLKLLKVPVQGGDDTPQVH